MLVARLTRRVQDITPLVRKNNFDTLARARALARVPYDADRGLTPSRPPNGPLYGPTSDLGDPRVDIR